MVAPESVSDLLEDHSEHVVRPLQSAKLAAEPFDLGVMVTRSLVGVRVMPVVVARLDALHPLSN